VPDILGAGAMAAALLIECRGRDAAALQVCWCVGGGGAVPGGFCCACWLQSVRQSPRMVSKQSAYRYPC
jgi:hypothetical protein